VHVVVAPDKFKGSLTAREVADRVAAGLTAVEPGLVVVRVPVADGGDGTVDAALAAGYERVPVRATGPTGEPVDTAYAVRDGVAVVEMADVSGLRLLPPDRLAPLTATSYGTGEVVRAALDQGARDVVLGIGGSASTDGGAGMLEALGVRLFDAADDPLPRGGGALADLRRVDLTGLHPAVADTRIVVACDVDNPLLGPHGAAAVYGPQKGASPDDIAVLETALTRWAEVVEAADGIGFDRTGRFWRVEVPLAIPLIVAGIRLATVSTIGLVTITGVLGDRFGGLGFFIFEGYRHSFPTEIFFGGISSIVLAVAADVALVRVQRRLTPWS